MVWIVDTGSRCKDTMAGLCRSPQNLTRLCRPLVRPATCCADIGTQAHEDSVVSGSFRPDIAESSLRVVLSLCVCVSNDPR